MGQSFFHDSSLFSFSRTIHIFILSHLSASRQWIPMSESTQTRITGAVHFLFIKSVYFIWLTFMSFSMITEWTLNTGQLFSEFFAILIDGTQLWDWQNLRINDSSSLYQLWIHFSIRNFTPLQILYTWYSYTAPQQHSIQLDGERHSFTAEIVHVENSVSNSALWSCASRVCLKVHFDVFWWQHNYTFIMVRGNVLFVVIFCLDQWTTEMSQVNSSIKTILSCN